MKADQLHEATPQEVGYQRESSSEGVNMMVGNAVDVREVGREQC